MAVKIFQLNFSLAKVGGREVYLVGIDKQLEGGIEQFALVDIN